MTSKFQSCKRLCYTASHCIPLKTEGKNKQQEGFLESCKRLCPTITYCILTKIEDNGMQ